jgi:ABC-type uncharacterized transport system ATPase component
MNKHTGESNGAEDIDEFVIAMNGVTLHIEKLDDNVYFIGLDGAGKSLSLNIGHWPGKKRNRKGGRLEMNIFENRHGGTWTY